MKNRKFFALSLTISVFIILLLNSCAVGVKKEIELSDEETAQMDRLLDSISGEKLLDYVKKLSSKTYSGRLTGTPEYTACSSWIGSLFEEWGLISRGDNDTYLQSYPNPYTIVFEGGELSYTYRSKG